MDSPARKLHPHFLFFNQSLTPFILHSKPSPTLLFAKVSKDLMQDLTITPPIFVFFSKLSTF